MRTRLNSFSVVVLTRVVSATKAKKHGYFGFVDSYESVVNVVEEFVALRIIPKPEEITPRT